MRSILEGAARSGVTQEDINAKVNKALDEEVEVSAGWFCTCVAVGELQPLSTQAPWVCEECKAPYLVVPDDLDNPSKVVPQNLPVFVESNQPKPSSMCFIHMGELKHTRAGKSGPSGAEKKTGKKWCITCRGLFADASKHRKTRSHQDNRRPLKRAKGICNDVATTYKKATTKPTMEEVRLMQENDLLKERLQQVEAQLKEAKQAGIHQAVMDELLQSKDVCSLNKAPELDVGSQATFCEMWDDTL
mmetsp:Transcript_67052/g.111478  ORF Transcript_67052/g.111478 Transcript_67052/m.111478 type:complete len:246 (-) Transcript_67052:137-874(-)|eukprot:CAMPEP_0119325138 /NCGR_PEP_ID=MMETSP1333-20130426/65066_1 /TAXON_ID=418940 /ORGANISM="Scyphosphaera apsteinii, Strain RCC1455" /LENGTH=245 /DNA_ID=CAMNT_0007333027 /DNA_START=49 /DNA_END=786 /DNA_ORIENTATION=+